MQIDETDRWAIVNTKTLAIVETWNDRAAARVARKTLNAHSYFHCDKGYRYRIIENPSFQPIN
jgi:hypothetical protein